MPDTRTRAQQNRAVRQEALRAQIAAQGHESYAVEIITKLRDVDTDIDSAMVQRYKVALDGHLALLKKYIPDLKSTELTSADGEPFQLIMPEPIARL